jgi:adenylate cyclase
VRLACQIRPQRDLVVRTLLPAHADPKRSKWHADAADWAVHQEVTVLFAYMRGFSNLALHQPPAELMHVLTRVIDDLAQAAELRGGRVAAIETDGIMAVFGLDAAAGAGARAALEAAADMLKAVDSANRDAGVSVSQPIRIGVGLHTGSVIATEVGDADRGVQLLVIGHTVVIADRLEEATKELAADCVVSAHTLAMARLPARAERLVQVSYKNGDAPVAAVARPRSPSWGSACVRPSSPGA